MTFPCPISSCVISQPPFKPFCFWNKNMQIFFYFVLLSSFGSISVRGALRINALNFIFLNLAEKMRENQEFKSTLHFGFAFSLFYICFIINKCEMVLEFECFRQWRFCVASSSETYAL